MSSGISDDQDEQDDRAGDATDGDTTDDDSVDGGTTPLAVADPSRIGPYLLLGRLGAGGMGRVYLARSEGGRTVAVKVVHEEHVSNAQFRARFRREIDAARRVGERYTAPVIDADPDADRPWVATGYVPGLSLEQIVRGYGPLPVDSVHALAEGLLHALGDIHSAGIVHRDLKPSNVMLTVEGPRVIDFGISRALETSVESLLTSTGMVVGSPGFMSPEQVRGQRAGVKSDVFTLGCVLTYAATGRLPFGAGASNQHAVMFQIVEAEPELEGVQDDALRALIRRCLAKAVDDRPGVEELLADPERVRPAAPGGAWLPPEVVARLARQAARLLDAEAAPRREAEQEAARQAAPEAAVEAAPQSADRATLGLRPESGAAGPVAEPAAGAAPGAAPGALPGPVPVDGTSAGGRRSRRRRWTVAVPAVFVITIGGGTVALIQPFGGDGSQAAPPAGSAPATPGAGGAPSAAGGSPAPGGQAPQSPEAAAQGGQVGGAVQGGQVGGAADPGGGGAQGAAAGAGTPGGGAGSPGGTGSGAGNGGGGAPGGTGAGTGPGGGNASGTTPGSTPGGAGSPSGGGSSGGDAVPSYFVGSWTYKGQFNIDQPVTVTISRSGSVRLITESQLGHCENIAKVVSVGGGGSRIDVGSAAVDKSRSPGNFCGALDPSFFTKSEPAGLQHNVGPAHGDGYYYGRS
ncbi:serine/threonine-protein kinase [Streptomyces sp. NPDC058746]|uniref:serine/threonine-protein kinase n=1 Tax=Streptomyces sp. NPDC058746 TaxID=3346622 RepID=UPI0036AA1570